MTKEIKPSKTTWSALSASDDLEIIEWAKAQPWAVEMAACLQDPSWHAEGDVWTHTAMVCEELFRMEQWDSLSRHSQILLLLTAIFHDSGKPATTRVEEGTGRIRSPKHAQHGMRIARRSLMEIGCDYATRELICNLILFHGRPLFLDRKDLPELELIKLSAFVDHRLLHMFALADIRGRTCNDKSDKEEVVSLWSLVAAENDCLEQPYQFANDHARFLFHRGNLDNLHYEPHEDYRCVMTITAGLPGAGKDSWLAERLPETPVVSLDEIRKQMGVSPTDNQGTVVQAGREQCRQFLRSGTDFVLNATNITRQTRKLWIDIGADYGARISIIYIEPPLDLILEQNSGRDARVPAQVIQRLIDRLDPPTLAECHELTVSHRAGSR